MKAKKLLVNGEEIIIRNRWDLRKALKIPKEERKSIVIDIGELGIMFSTLLEFALSFKEISDVNLGMLSVKDRQLLCAVLEGLRSIRRDKISNGMIGKNKNKVSPRAIWETYAEFVGDYIKVRDLPTREEQARELGCSVKTLRRYLRYDHYHPKR